MTDKELTRILARARDLSPGEGIDRKFQHLMRLEIEHRKLPVPHLRPITAVAFLFLALGGVLGIGHAVREVQYMADSYQQEQQNMYEARRDMLSNTEHIYSVLFQDEQ